MGQYVLWVLAGVGLLALLGLICKLFDNDEAAEWMEEEEDED